MQIQAVIFDMDGLLLDTEPVYIESMKKAMGEHGRTLTNELIKACTGVSQEEITRALEEHLGRDFPVESANRKHREYAYDHFRSRGVALKKGALSLLRSIEELSLPMGLATSTVREVAESLLENAGIAGLFSVAVFGDQIEQGKPFPDIFLKTADRLSAAPANCLVFEDSENGILGASRAGMRAVLVPDIMEPPEEVRKLAFSEYPDLEAAERELQYLLA